MELLRKQAIAFSMKKSVSRQILGLALAIAAAGLSSCGPAG